MFQRAAFVVAMAAALGPAALGADRPVSSAYLLGGADMRFLSNRDADDYFGTTQFGTESYPNYVAHLGVQMRQLLALELSAELGPARSYKVSYPAREVEAQWSLASYSLTPGIAWSGANPWLGTVAVSFLGLRFGVANLSGAVRDTALSVEGRYEQEAQALDYGVIFRTSQILAGHLSIGLEGGYDWTRFPQITNRNGSGAYANVRSPERNVGALGHAGDTTVLDFSGWHVALVLGFWSRPPVELEP